MMALLTIGLALVDLTPADNESLAALMALSEAAVFPLTVVSTQVLLSSFFFWSSALLVRALVI
jgi:hypothetical protein|tara:strand:+ start:197 stop:385 length:189 start_codon:yes stop_codon:yes gene_type:complete